jgi:hypothetical protein
VINGKGTIALADASADEHAYFVWGIPDNFDRGGSFVFVHAVYLCDNSTLTEGELNVGYTSITDDVADGAAVELTVKDTPAAQNDWNVTAAMQIPKAAVGASTVALGLDFYHDISDPLCNAQDINLLGLRLFYTTSKNY